MTCPRCNSKMEAVIVLTGGCSGHFSGDNRCYCDSPDCHVEFSCPNYRGYRSRAKGDCNQPDIKAGGPLGDSNAIGRWITERI